MNGTTNSYCGLEGCQSNNNNELKKQFYHHPHQEHLHSHNNKTEQLIDTATHLIRSYNAVYDKDLQTFLTFSKTIPDIIISKSSPNSPILIKAREEARVDLNSNHIKTRSLKKEEKVEEQRMFNIQNLSRRLSQDSLIESNLNKGRPKLERLNSGETARSSLFWNMNRQSSSCSLSSLCSVDTNCMSDVSDFDVDELNSSAFCSDDDASTKRESMWVKLRKAVRWSPFMQSYKKQYPWIQLAGHQGGFKSGERGTILKKSCKNEVECMEILMNDILRPYVPEFKMVIIEDDHSYIQMQDLLAEFEQPSFVMDCKIGTRTYLEDEVNKISKPRKDLYLKMVAVDPSEPTDEENETCSCSKPRYMQWREQLSSTATLGFRIEGIKRGENNPDKDFKKIKSEEDISSVFQRFINNRKDVQEKYLERLKAIKSTLLSSKFFKSHEIIGSSLLFIHDASGKSSIWIIDFGKTIPITNGTVLDHQSEWVLGNHEDGYLFGLDNMINIWSNMQPENS